MKKRISTYWPVAIVFALALGVLLQAAGPDGICAEPRGDMTVSSVSAELARAISLGFVDSDATAAVALPAAQQTL
jgi:hypothetical protein